MLNSVADVTFDLGPANAQLAFDHQVTHLLDRFRVRHGLDTASAWRHAQAFFVCHNVDFSGRVACAPDCHTFRITRNDLEIRSRTLFLVCERPLSDIMVSTYRMRPEDYRGLGKFYPGSFFVSVSRIDGRRINGLIQQNIFARLGGKLRPLYGSQYTDAGFSIAPLSVPQLEALKPLLLTGDLMRRYYWRVQFRKDADHKAISFYCSSESARQAFALRDKPADGSRRPALRHWVSKAIRKGSSSQREPFYLRGKTEFRWSGLDCILTPSDLDRELEIGRKLIMTKAPEKWEPCNLKGEGPSLIKNIEISP